MVERLRKSFCKGDWTAKDILLVRDGCRSDSLCGTDARDEPCWRARWIALLISLESCVTGNGGSVLGIEDDDDADRSWSDVAVLERLSDGCGTSVGGGLGRCCSLKFRIISSLERSL
jgi:hypothetical protein